LLSSQSNNISSPKETITSNANLAEEIDQETFLTNLLYKAEKKSSRTFEVNNYVKPKNSDK